MTGIALAASVGGAGAVGACTRYAIDGAVTRRYRGAGQPGTMIVNIAGSFIFGLLTGCIIHHHLADVIGVVGGVGFCGGFTTFSATAFETVRLFEAHERSVALVVLVLGIAAACLAGACGLGLALV